MRSHEAHFCPRCAAPLADRSVYGQVRRACSACEFVLFENPAGASGAVVIDRDRRVLLVRRGIPPHQGSWALPAGYQEIDESPTEAAVRETWEETGVRIHIATLIDLVFVPDDPRKPANVAMFLATPISGTAHGRDDATDAGWFALDELPSPFAFASNNALLQQLTDSGERAQELWKAWGKSLADSPPAEQTGKQPHPPTADAAQPSDPSPAKDSTT